MKQVRRLNIPHQNKRAFHSKTGTASTQVSVIGPVSIAMRTISLSARLHTLSKTKRKWPITGRIYWNSDGQ